MQKKYVVLIALIMGFMSELQAVKVRTGVGTSIYGVRFSIFRDGEIKGEVVAAVVGLVLAAKVAYDVSWHNAYSTRVKEHYQGLKQCVCDKAVKNITDEAFLNFSTQDLREDVLFLEASISNAYDSWLCPWNWTSSQKKAHQHIQIVSIFTLYAELLRAGDRLSDQDILQYCRNMFVFSTMYPYVACHCKMQNHLDFIKSFVISQNDEKLNFMLQDMATQLEKFKRRLQGQKEYVDELQIIRTHALQQECIDAQRSSRSY